MKPVFRTDDINIRHWGVKVRSYPEEVSFTRIRNAMVSAAQFSFDKFIDASCLFYHELVGLFSPYDEHTAWYYIVDAISRQYKLAGPIVGSYRPHPFFENLRLAKTSSPELICNLPFRTGYSVLPSSPSLKNFGDAPRYAFQSFGSLDRFSRDLEPFMAVSLYAEDRYDKTCVQENFPLSPAPSFLSTPPGFVPRASRPMPEITSFSLAPKVIPYVPRGNYYSTEHSATYQPHDLTPLTESSLSFLQSGELGSGVLSWADSSPVVGPSAVPDRPAANVTCTSTRPDSPLVATPPPSPSAITEQVEEEVELFPPISQVLAVHPPLAYIPVPCKPVSSFVGVHFVRTPIKDFLFDIPPFASYQPVSSVVLRERNTGRRVNHVSGVKQHVLEGVGSPEVVAVFSLDGSDQCYRGVIHGHGGIGFSSVCRLEGGSLLFSLYCCKGSLCRRGGKANGFSQAAQFGIVAIGRVTYFFKFFFFGSRKRVPTPNLSVPYYASGKRKISVWSSSIFG